jgi:hypothetical protein
MREMRKAAAGVADLDSRTIRWLPTMETKCCQERKVRTSSLGQTSWGFRCVPPVFAPIFSSTRHYDDRQKCKDENCKNPKEGRYQVLRLRVAHEAREYEGHVNPVHLPSIGQVRLHP